MRRHFCTLSKICLSNDRGDPTRYVAVSYVWGDPKATETIFVNGTAFQATKALVSFLRHYSHIPAELHGLLLWIDEFASTLCVEDFDPSAEQTGMPKNKAWTSVAHLLTRSYWERVWIHQELILPAVVLLLCGSHTIFLEEVLAFVAWTTYIKLESRSASMSLEIWHFLNWPQWLANNMGIGRLVRLELRGNFQQQRRLPARWNDLEEAFGPAGLRASDPRDIVYGILGVCHLPITPDYAKSVYDVYLELTTFGIAQGHVTGFLESAGYTSLGEMPRNIWKLPTWVPDFSKYGCGIIDIGTLQLRR
jgi:hypothetical protein